MMNLVITEDRKHCIIKINYYYFLYAKSPIKIALFNFIMIIISYRIHQISLVSLI